jgi:O-antigen/teichoic acid export membrane protein
MPDTARQRLWAWADQGLVSLGNFLSYLVVARGLPPVQFGVYAVVFAGVLVLNTFHAALVTFSLSVRGPSMDGRQLVQLTSNALLTTVVLSTVLASLASAAVWSTGRPALIPSVLLALVCWQAQETTRTAFFAHFRQRDALAGDSLSYLGQSALLLVLARRNALSLESAFLAIAVSSAAAFVVQAVQLRLPWPKVRQWTDFVRQAAAFGTWGLPARIATVFSMQAFPWVLFYTHGASAAAAFQALASAVAFSNPVMIATANLVTATVAGGYGRRGFDLALRHACHGWALIVPFFALAALFPAATLRVLYGSATPYQQFASLLGVMVVAYACEAVAMQASAVIGGLGQTRQLFLMQGSGLIVALAFGLPLAVHGGLGPALGGFVAVQLGRVSYGLWTCARLWPVAELRFAENA